MTEDQQSDGSAIKRSAEEAEKRARKPGVKKRLAKEVCGRDGPEPTRYGDWESKGIASDF